MEKLYLPRKDGRGYELNKKAVLRVEWLSVDQKPQVDYFCSESVVPQHYCPQSSHWHAWTTAEMGVRDFLQNIPLCNVTISILNKLEFETTP